MKVKAVYLPVEVKPEELEKHMLVFHQSYGLGQFMGMNPHNKRVLWDAAWTIGIGKSDERPKRSHIQFDETLEECGFKKAQLFAVLEFDCFSEGDEVIKENGEKAIVEKVVAGIPKLVGSDDFHKVYKLIGKISKRANWIKPGEYIEIQSYTQKDVDNLSGFFKHKVGDPVLYGGNDDFDVKVKCPCCKDYK
ncbi:MAG: hypothetical protein AABY15_02085 [Nanoarchaeota archaeon]